MLSRIITGIFNEQTGCEELCISVYRAEDGVDGVLFIAWHDGDEGEYLIQSKFIPMPFDIAESFIEDFSTTSADRFISSFEP